MNKYSNYNSNDFLNEDSFIQWLLNADEKSVAFWERYRSENSEQTEEIDEAIAIYNQFSFSHQELSVDEIFTIWNTIKHHSEKKKNGVLHILKYAAIFILVFVGGATSYYCYTLTQSKEFILAEATPVDFGEAQIVLSNGKSIPLHSKNSEIKYDAIGENVIIGNDTISQQEDTVELHTNRVIIPYGKSSQITLSDGTKVWLNAGSQLMYPSVFDEKQREVLLVGEAFFEVVRNEESPFIVRTEQVDIEVLGTRFDVSTYPDDKLFHAVLIAGSVSVATKKQGLLGLKDKNILEPNEMFLLDKESGVFYVDTVDVDSYTAWRDGMFICKKQDLNRVVRKLERYYNKKIHIKNPMLGSYRISGKLDLKSDISEVLDVLQVFVPIDWGKQQNGDYFIVKRN